MPIHLAPCNRRTLAESRRRRTATIVALLVAALVALPAWTAMAAAQNQPLDVKPVIPIDRIVVVVNDDVITDTELTARLADVKRALRARRIEPPPEPVLRKQVLERLVLDRVQLQLAARTGVRVSDEDVERALRAIAERNRMDMEQFYKALREEGMDLERYRKQIREEITLTRLIDREINNRITVSDTEVENFLADRKRESRVDDAYNISHILIAVPESATSDDIRVARFKATQIHQSLTEGDSFEQAAIAHSQGQNALEGGALGWKQPGQLPAIFLKVLEELQPGEVSEIVRSPAGFHILRLNGRRRGDRTEPVTQTHVRHILIRPSEVQSIADVRTKLVQLRDRVLSGEDFAELARAHSEDTRSAAKGGDLGWVNPGQTVPEFEREMKRLEVDAISEPVETPFGLHLIQVLGRREHDVSEERDRNAARRQIHARKADERYDQWLRRMRDEAYVQYRLDDTH